MPFRRVVARAARTVQRLVVPPPAVVKLVRDERARVLDNQLLAGRSALITGAGRNIGRSVALEMAAQGAAVYFTDVDAAAVAALEAELAARGARGRGFVSDITQPDDIARLCDALAAEVVIDALVNNVGLDCAGSFLKASMDEVRATFETNVFGPLGLTQRIVAALVAAGRPGSVVFISSVHESATSGRLGYSASKAAIGMAARELATELAQHRIRVNAILPGGVLEPDGDDLKRFAAAPLYGAGIPPWFIGRAVVYLTAEYFSQFTTGSSLTVDAGLLAQPPTR